MYRFTSYLFIFSLVFAIFFSFENNVFGQVSFQSIKQQISISVTPENPGQNEEVSIKIESSDYNLSAANITWSINGVVKKNGLGEKSFTFTTGAIGSVQDVIILINPLNEPNSVDRTPFTKEIIIRPADVDLIWQAKAVKPTFYRGKTLYAPQGEAFILALPHFVNSQKKTIPSSNLIYTWKRNGDVVLEASGYGKDVYSYLSPVVSQTKNISVVVASTDGSTVAEKSIELSPTNPFIAVYVDHPLFGLLLNKEVGQQFNLKEKEVSLVAVPYYFSKNQKNDLLEYTWTVNSASIQNQDQKNKIVFRQENTGVKGYSNISLSIKTPEKLLQFGQKTFSIQFGE